MNDSSTVLIIDDDPGLRKTLVDILCMKGYDATAAANGTDALSLLEKGAVNVVLIDLDLPDISGIELLNRVRADYPQSEAIILTGNATLDSAIEATNRGAFSYLLKPCDIEQLVLQIQRAVEKRRKEEDISRQQAELKKVNADLQVLYEEAKVNSLHDPLTGLANRRFMDIQLDKIVESARRYKRPLSVIMVDIDHFKNYNDRLGHLEGDRLLVKVAQTILNEVRNADFVFRYGGEEFLVILPETGPAMACTVAERLRLKVAAEAGITISLGVDSCADANNDRETLVRRADAALYRAKENGRDRVAYSASQA